MLLSNQVNNAINPEGIRKVDNSFWILLGINKQDSGNEWALRLYVLHFVTSMVPGWTRARIVKTSSDTSAAKAPSKY